MYGWLSLDSIPERVNVCLSLPNSEDWLAQFRGAILELTRAENWEQHGTLSALEMSDEWRAVFFDFMEGQCSMIPVATILPFAGQSAPSGYLLCHGQTVLRADYPNLFGIVGTLYGASVSGTEFNIPDLRHQVPVGVDEDGPSGFDIGDIGGELTHTLTLAEIASHTHIQNSHNHTQDSHLHSTLNRFRTSTITGNSANPEGGEPSVGTFGGANTGGTVGLNQVAVAVNQVSGGDAPHNNLQPYLAVNYIIKF